MSVALLTPSQTVGPFFALVVPRRGRLALAGDQTPGCRVTVAGSVRDGEARGVPDALVEIWQAGADGRLNHAADPRSDGPDQSFGGFGRIHTDPEGRFLIETVKPGPVPAPDGGTQAPHLLVGLFARGLLTRLVTRIYFADEPVTATDPILHLVPEARRGTLIAEPGAAGCYRFDIVLQGPNETVFFDV